MPPGPEARLVRAIRSAIATRWPDAWIVKTAGGPWQVGLPDLLACIDGRLVALEAKAAQPGETVDHARGRATAQQLAVLGAITRAGGAAAVVGTVEDALDTVATACIMDLDTTKGGSA